MRIGIAADHGGFALKQVLGQRLLASGHEVVDFGALTLSPGDDFPDYIVPLAWAVAKGEVTRGIAVCGSGVGACVAANKVPGVRAGLISETFSARQGVEDDDMNLICLGGRVIGEELAWELARAFLAARFTGEERFRRRLKKIADLEGLSGPSENGVAV
jgi:ribose 5-phosphate isomerase B